jgi:hypothetical protein
MNRKELFRIALISSGLANDKEAKKIAAKTDFSKKNHFEYAPMHAVYEAISIAKNFGEVLVYMNKYSAMLQSATHHLLLYSIGFDAKPSEKLSPSI